MANQVKQTTQLFTRRPWWPGKLAPSTFGGSHSRDPDSADLCRAGSRVSRTLAISRWFFFGWLVAGLSLNLSSLNPSILGDEPAGQVTKRSSEEVAGAPVADSPESQHNRASARELSRAFRFAAARAVPSVVTVKVRTRDAEAEGVIDIVGGNDASFDGLGSGVIIEAGGLILTNHHVVKDAKHIEVMLNDGRLFKARDVKADPPSDLAILRIDAQDSLPVAPIGNARELNVGDWVLAIGSPFSLESTVSAGIISSKNRPMAELVSGRVLQTDAAVNPGNSGGPLIDLDGQVIGINTAISSSSGSFQGIGFAIPIHRAIWVKNELLAHGRVRHARMGAQLGSIPLDVAKQLDLPARGGAYIITTVPDRPADKAGLKPGDIVVSFDHQGVTSQAELAELIAISPIDQALEVEVMRSGQKQSLKITLEARD